MREFPQKVSLGTASFYGFHFAQVKLKSFQRNAISSPSISSLSHFLLFPHSPLCGTCPDRLTLSKALRQAPAWRSLHLELCLIFLPPDKAHPLSSSSLCSNVPPSEGFPGQPFKNCALTRTVLFSLTPCFFFSP